MKVITGSRRSGRTFNIILTAIEKNSLIVCHDSLACRAIQSMAAQSKTKVRTMTFENFIRGGARGENSVVIDNIDFCLERLSGTPIDAMSCLSNETVTLNRDPEFKDTLG